MADDRSNLFVSEDFSFNDEDDLTIELETFMNILEETPETEQVNFRERFSLFFFFFFFVVVKFISLF